MHRQLGMLRIVEQELSSSCLQNLVRHPPASRVNCDVSIFSLFYTFLITNFGITNRITQHSHANLQVFRFNFVWFAARVWWLTSMALESGINNLNIKDTQIWPSYLFPVNQIPLVQTKCLKPLNFHNYCNLYEKFSMLFWCSYFIKHENFKLKQRNPCGFSFLPILMTPAVTSDDGGRLREFSLPP